MATYRTVVRHWFPFVTICPVTCLPELVYITAEFNGFIELYAVRKAIRKAVRKRRFRFMEVLADDVMGATLADKVTVTLAFGRHVAIVEKDKA